MSGYNKHVGDRMLLRQGKEAEKEGSHAGDSLFFFFFSISKSMTCASLSQCNLIKMSSLNIVISLS